MNITFMPQRDEDVLTVNKHGEVLTINGINLDFSVIPDGATLPAEAVDCKFIVGDVERADGELRLTLLLPHGPDASTAARFPQPIVDPADGPVRLPQ